MKLEHGYYSQKDVVKVAKDLIGKVLYTHIHDKICAGIITETEAYAGISDKASHAYGNRRTARTETMYMQGGVAYVYLCYGMHHLLNVVTNDKDIPHAVLIRAIQPYQGLDIMLERRKTNKLHKNLLNGPGKLSMAMGIDKHLDTQSLLGDKIWLEDKSISIPESDIEITPRIGVDYAEEDALLPYRFVVNKPILF